MLTRFGMESCKPVSTPGQPHSQLIKAKADENVIHEDYRQMVGCLQYIQCLTRPDIANAVREVAQHQNAPTTDHHIAVKRVMRYLKGTIEHGLCYGGTAADEELVGWVDANYAEDPDTRRSITGYVNILYGGPVSWKSTKQSIVSHVNTCNVVDALWNTGVVITTLLHQYYLIQLDYFTLIEDKHYT